MERSLPSVNLHYVLKYPSHNRKEKQHINRLSKLSLSICCFFFGFLFSVSRLFPLPSALFSTDLKGERFSGWIRSKGGRFCPKRHSRLTFQLSMKVCTTFADEHRKRAADAIGNNTHSENWNLNNPNEVMKTLMDFCLFIKKLYLCIRMSYTSRNLCKHVEIRTVANSLPRFLTIRTTNLISADY